MRIFGCFSFHHCANRLSRVCIGVLGLISAAASADAVTDTGGNAVASSTQHVLVNRSEENIRNDDRYPIALLEAALAVTRERYGPFRVNLSPSPLSRPRALRALLNDDINVMVSPPGQPWDNKALRVQFPIARGLLSFRIFLIKEKYLSRLHAASNLAQLSRIPTGSGTHWTLTDILHEAHFEVVLGVGDNSLVDMFKNERFITYSRGLNEVFIEYEKMKPNIPDLVIDEKFLLYTHMPTYFYVSPREPQLAQRLLEGLQALHANGEFAAIFDTFHGDIVTRAQLHKRQIIHLNNPNVRPQDFALDSPYVLQLAPLTTPETEAPVQVQ